MPSECICWWELLVICTCELPCVCLNFCLLHFLSWYQSWEELHYLLNAWGRLYCREGVFKAEKAILFGVAWKWIELCAECSSCVQSAVGAERRPRCLSELRSCRWRKRAASHHGNLSTTEAMTAVFLWSWNRNSVNYNCRKRVFLWFFVNAKTRANFFLNLWFNLLVHRNYINLFI